MNLPLDCSIAHFRAEFFLCVTTRLRAKPFLCKFVSPARPFSCKSNSFSCQKFCTRTRFDTVAKHHSEKPISQFRFASVSKRVFLQIFSYENEFHLHENKLVGETHFHNGLAIRLIMTQRQTRTRKWANGLFVLR